MSRLTSALPTPTIFKIYVYDDKLKISLGIYVPALNDSEPVDHLKWINKKLKFYVSYATSTEIIDKIASREISIFESMSGQVDKYTTFNSYQEFSFNFGTDYDQWNQKIYDTSDAITYLYTAEVEIDYDFGNNLTLYAFSSAVDLIITGAKLATLAMNLSLKTAKLTMVRRLAITILRCRHTTIPHCKILAANILHKVK